MATADRSDLTATAGPGLGKAPTGVAGLDLLTGGGLPQGRTTLVCGGPGCGKTLLGVQFLVRGILDHGEPGVLIAFEESAQELADNVRSLGWDLDALQAQERLVIDHVRIAEADIVETGAWDLDGLFLRIGAAIDAVGAQRVVLDTIESLFGPLANETLLRAELRRLFRWLNEREVTTILTGERGEGTLTRHGLEEYVSDCVILLDHRVHDEISTRRLRIVKYRGSAHGANEYPFLINEDGFSVLPLSAINLSHMASRERLSFGVPGLDALFEGGGPYRASSILVSGSPGAGKSTLAARFLEAGCERGERAVLFAFEESPDQIVRNMSGVGIDLARWQESGRLAIVARRPTEYGLEQHLVRIMRVIDDHAPVNVAIDPLSSFVGDPAEVRAVLARMIDVCKTRGITAMLNVLAHGGFDDPTQTGISSLIDTWIDVRNLEHNGERNRAINVLKCRGVRHSNQVREFVLGSEGLALRDVYAEAGAVLMGASRVAREAEIRREASARETWLEATRRRRDARRRVLDAQIATLEAERDAEELELTREIQSGEARARQIVLDRARAEVWRTLGPAPEEEPP